MALHHLHILCSTFYHCILLLKYQRFTSNDIPTFIIKDIKVNSQEGDLLQKNACRLHKILFLTEKLKMQPATDQL